MIICTAPLRHRQRGVALVVLLALFSIVLIGVLLTTTRSALQLDRARSHHRKSIWSSSDALIARAAI